MEKADPVRLHKRPKPIVHHTEILKYTAQQFLYFFMWCFVGLTFLYLCILLGNNIKRFLIIKNANIKNLQGHKDILEDDFCRNATKRMRSENLGYTVCIKAEQEYMKDPWTNAFQIFYEELSAYKFVSYLYNIFYDLFDFVFRKEFLFMLGSILPLIPTVYKYTRYLVGYNE
jgi:hypothetical protein